MFKWIKILFSKALRIFKSFINAAFDEAKQLLIASYKDTAITVVRSLVNSDISNEDKRKKAFDAIKKIIGKEAVEIKDGIINWLIETAVQYVKNNK